MSSFESQELRFISPRKPRRRVWLRMLVGCLLVVVASAATVATGTLLEVKGFTDALKQSPQLKLGNELANANAGGAQTLLLIGSDKRAKGAIDASSPPRSDTMLLVRLDPNQPDTTMLSVPRDLKVMLHPDNAPPSVQKINASYSIGGAKLVVKTVKQVLGVPINHVVDINFAGFKALVNYLGCIYTQVDRRYFHSNVGVPAADTYDEINIQPGYQKLCGDDALHYVRYRHGDTDLVRSSRQQDFLRSIKNQIGALGLVSRRAGIERIFGKYASTDIRSADDVLKLLELLVQSASHPVRQVTFQATLGPSFVTATKRQIQQTVHAFLNGGVAPGHIQAQSSRPGRRRSQSSVPLIPATASELAQGHSLATTVPIRIYYPARRVATAGATPDETRPYLLNGHYAYVVVVAEGGLGQYYDLEGTTWTRAPILSHPSQTLRLGRRRYSLYFEGQRLRTVAWRDHGAAYWVTNTLQNILTNRQMLAIAQSSQIVH
jgi:polyisoprenyl-teichoic acid--peptidoglycan teichoic acid transferase